ncbi:MAG: isocitrate lyase/phosphoenolpyruvate mutase family protein [Chloroflexi bacterium]|nr:MAG: isocitrate lyase/phosphoenolpyruvate mutase family protein [Chloroflexota bacterium]
MSTQQEKASIFAALHQKHSPVILFNTWDPGSTQVVAGKGAKAIALGSHGVAEAFGYEDGENIPLELVLENAHRTVAVTDLPVTLDFETGYGETPSDVAASITKALETGVVGVNIEDKISGGDSLYSIEDQVERLRAARQAANEFGVDLVINARSDLFKDTDPDLHDDALLDQALERARAYAEAGATSFFLPLMKDAALIKRLCDESPLPVNIIFIDGMGIPTPEQLASFGASRISYGPGPWLQMKEWLGDKATAAFEIQS